MELSAMSYWGGKSRPNIRKWINSILPQDTNVCYVEPFAGMLGILLSRPPSKTEIINDVDGHVSNWWEVIRDDPDKLLHLIEFTPHCRSTYEKAYDELLGGQYNDDSIKRAWATFVCVGHGMVHGLGKKGFGVRYSGSTKANSDHFTQKIIPLAERLRNVQIENTDACLILERTAKYDFALVYCDPPYAGARTEPYTSRTIDIDRVTDLLMSQKGRVAISGYNDNWDHLGWNKHKMSTCFAPVGEHAGHKETQDRVECLWENFGHSPQMLFL